MLCCQYLQLSPSRWTTYTYIYQLCCEVFKKPNDIYVATSVTKFGAILFTPIMHTAEFCFAVDSWRSGLPCVAIVAPPHPTPSAPPMSLSFIRQHIPTAHLSPLTNTVPDTACLVYGSNRSWERPEYQYWPMKQARTVDQKVFSGVL